MSGSIELVREGARALVTITHPERRNALTRQMWLELAEAMVSLNRDPAVHMVIIRGEGAKAFSAGADIQEFSRERFNGASAREYDTHVHAAIEAVQNLHALSLSMVRGDCVGGGAEIALATDWRFASNTLRMGITPAKLGIVYGPQETARLLQRVGLSQALDLLATGRLVGADEARAMGLVDRVVEDDLLESSVKAFVEEVECNSWAAVRRMKEMLRQLSSGTPPSDPALNLLVYDAYASPDYQERVEAFLRKRR